MIERFCRRAYERGRADERAELVQFLLEQADLHQGEVGDQRRRSALRYAATLIVQGKAPQRPPAGRGGGSDV